MRVLILFICGLSLAAVRTYELYNIEYAEEYFKEFIKEYDKEYANETEKQMRFDIFKQNLEKINQRNLKNDTATFGITFFSDLTTEEFLNKYTGLRSGSIGDSKCENQRLHFPGGAPDSFDWRDQKKVSRVKDQKLCASCWAFSATGNLESQYAIKYNEMIELSEQQLVDCDKRSHGCNGTADLANPFMYWTEKGSVLEKDYPYTAETETCAFDASKVKVKLAGCTAYTGRDENALKETLHRVGPLTVGVHANSFMAYRHGVLRYCEKGKGNHAVLLVGYGTERGIPFWLIKNSWGEKWGESGYIRIKRGMNACNIMGQPSVSARLS